MSQASCAKRKHQSRLYRPLVTECGPTGLPCWKNRIRTWLFCWPDYYNPKWTIVLWTIGSFAFFVADTASDLSVAVEYYDGHQYLWANMLITFVCLPTVISIVYFVIYKKVPWYHAYPFGTVFWAWRTLESYFKIPSPNTILTPPDAIKYLQTLRAFQNCNHERGRVGDVDVYFGSLPQLILQSAIASTVAIDTGVKEVSLVSWLSLCLSSLNLLRYEPSSHESRTGIIIDIETVLEPALYDYLAENVFDIMSIVPRAVAIGCFLTVHPFLHATTFFQLHILVTFLWFYFSAPECVPGLDSRQRDFRGQRTSRGSYFKHFQASVASLVFPPTHRVWPKDFQSWRQRLNAVLTKQFVVVTCFQFLEVSLLLAFWVISSEGGIRVLQTVVTVMTWTTLRVVLHVGFYVFVLFPLYTREWESCCRRRGLIAKSEIIRMAESFGVYSCAEIRTHLEKILEISSSPTFAKNVQSTMKTALERLIENTQRDHVGSHSTPGVMKHRLMAIRPLERTFFQHVRMHATTCLMFMKKRHILSQSSTETWKQLLADCNELIDFWNSVLFACLTNRVLLTGFQETDVVYSPYPRMYNQLVSRNNLIFKRTRGLPVFSIRLPVRQTLAPIPIEEHPILKGLQEKEAPERRGSSAFGELLDLEFIT